MKKTILFLAIPLIGLGLYSFYSNSKSFTKFHVDELDAVNYSANPPTGRTGAPGEGNCTACHSGSTVSAAGVIDYSFSGTGYLPAQTYDITLTTTSGSKNGFQMTILDGSDEAAGTFTAGTNSATTTASSRNYIHHTTSTGITSWTFQWTAPSTNVGPLTAYYSFNESNANGNTAGDIIYLGQETIGTDASIGLSKYEKIDKDYSVYVDQINQSLKVEYKIANSARTVIQLIDINGKLIAQKELGIQDKGKYQDDFELSQYDLSGIYIVSLFQDNLVFNRKVMIP